MADSDSIKLCECGCGRPTNLADRTRPKWGHVKGQPMRFVAGHGYVRHRLTKSPTWKCWRSMRNRCLNEKSDQWPLYGARGIKICERWSSFNNFLADMGERPNGMTLDRIDADGDYCPENCRWATASQQALNRRKGRLVTAFGRTMHATEWQREMGLGRNTIYYRLKAGWSPERAVSEPDKKSSR